MTNMKPTDIVTGLRNTRRSFGDGTLNGRSRVATPARTGSARKIPTSRISPPNAILGSGETITLSGTTRDANDRLEWSAIASSEKLSSGFTSVSLPTTDIPTSLVGYYDVQDLTFELSSASGATVTVYAVDSGGNTRVVGSYAGSSTWKHLDPHDFALDVLDGESIRIVVDQPVTGTFYGNFRLVEQSRVVAAETPLVAPTEAPNLTYSDNPGSWSHEAPVGTQSGDVMVCAWVIGAYGDIGGSITNISPASGWTEIARSPSGAADTSGKQRRIYYRVADSQDETQSRTYLWGTSGDNPAASYTVASYPMGSGFAGFSSVDEGFTSTDGATLTVSGEAGADWYLAVMLNSVFSTTSTTSTAVSWVSGVTDIVSQPPTSSNRIGPSRQGASSVAEVQGQVGTSDGFWLVVLGVS